MATTASQSVVVVPNAGYVILIAAAAAMGGFLFGFDTAVINGTVLALKQEFNASSLGLGLAVSLALLGSAIGAFVVGPLADRIGRVRCMLMASALFAISAVGSGMPIGLADFIFWRVLGGIGVGAASVIAPAYIAECSPAEMRGRLGSLQQLAIVIGIFAALLGNYAIGSAAGSASAPFWFGREAWRWMFWSEAPAAIMYGIFALVIPESPRYLVAQGRHTEARVVLARMIGPHASIKVEEISRTVSREHKPRLADLRGRWGLLPIVWVGMVLSMFQQFVGINVIFYYSSALWRIVGFTEADSLLITMITSITNIATTLVAIACIDKFGRKPLLLAGSVGMLLTLGAMAWVFGTASVDANGFPVLSSNAGLVALLAANVYVFCFGFSWGPVTWVLLGEMFNNRIRASALALGAGVQWIANFAVSTTFPPIAFNLGLGIAYGLYAGFAAVSFFFVLAFIRETKGKELEDMQ
ncbi:MAG: sugar porter family MFS transporter [Rhodospirillales bacterium]|nr:sugar porter family MFS transporter [Rhodospirillales bacterium]